METTTAVETGSAPKPHLFIFDSESQEEGSQPMDSDNAAVPTSPRPMGEKAGVVPLTQAQLNDDVQRMEELIKETSQVKLREPGIAFPVWVNPHTLHLPPLDGLNHFTLHIKTNCIVDFSTLVRKMTKFTLLPASPHIAAIIHCLFILRLLLSLPTSMCVYIRI